MDTKPTPVVGRSEIAVKPEEMPFERARRRDSDGREFWSSRELAQALGYTDYRNFDAVVLRARTACQNSGNSPSDHFVEITEMVEIGSGAKREIRTTMLSRYACYLIVQNADPSKPIVAIGQTYFALQTRRQEVNDARAQQSVPDDLDERAQQLEEERRLMLRNELKQHNTRLMGAAKAAGVIDARDYAIFQNHGYAGLYGGLFAHDIRAKKGLKPSQQILDHMGSTELAANLFRATQTEEKLRRDGIKGKDHANFTHRTVGAKVRKTIQDLGGTMPEDLPAVESIKKLEARQRRLAAGHHDEDDET